jgi:Cu-processing system permease protein
VNALVIARFSLQEALSRRVIAAGVLLSVAFLALFTLGFWLLYAEVLRESAAASPRPNRTPETIVVGNVLTVMGMYAVHFLSSFLALFLSVGAIAAEVESGALHAVLARPLRRWELVAGRWLAGALMICLYVAVMASSVLLIAQGIAGYEAPRPIAAIALMALGAVLLLTLGVFGSTLLSTIANGVVLFSLFGLAWLGGIIEVLGTALGNLAMVNVGIVVGLLVPSDAIWRGASYYIQSPAFLMGSTASADRGGIPFAAIAEPAAAQVVWAVLYLVLFLVGSVVSFARRDL